MVLYFSALYGSIAKADNRAERLDYRLRSFKIMVLNGMESMLTKFLNIVVPVFSVLSMLFASLAYTLQEITK